MENKIIRVEALSGLRLKARFANGDMLVYDVAPLQKELPIFLALSSVHGLFENVHVDAAGYGVMWNDELDLASEEIWKNGKLIAEGMGNDRI